jgi:4-hydroxy-2-oxoheptanedioate aldolase
MRTSRILTKIRAGQTALGTTMHLTDPSVFELAALMGFDAIWMDMEHHFYSLETAGHMMRAARAGAGADIVARPGKGEFMRMSRMLEAGATGIMYPRCDSPAEAKEVVRWAKFAPVGQRGFDGAGADNPYCTMPMADYVHFANEQTFVLIQIEDPAVIDKAEAIIAVPGVDMLMLGPADFTVLSGIPGQFDHPSVDAAIRAIARAAKNGGKHWAAIAFNVDHGKRMKELGASLLFHGGDIVMIKTALEQIRSSFAQQLGITFDSRLSDGKSYLEKR